jgi:hypothetical protein
MKRSTIIEINTLLFVILFLYTAASKIIDFSLFQANIASSPLLAPMARLIAVTLPILELIVVFLLIFPSWRLKGLYSSLFLMILFTSYIICILTLNEKIPCSCGGIIQQLSWKQHIIFNSIFIFIAIYTIFLQKKIVSGSNSA